MKQLIGLFLKNAKKRIRKKLDQLSIMMVGIFYAKAEKERRIL